jgi:hypothetical protein
MKKVPRKNHSKNNRQERKLLFVVNKQGQKHKEIHEKPETKTTDSIQVFLPRLSTLSTFHSVAAVQLFFIFFFIKTYSCIRGERLFSLSTNGYKLYALLRSYTVVFGKI